MDNTKRYKNLVAAYEKAYASTRMKQSNLLAAQKEWNHVKSSREEYDQLMLQLKSKAAKQKSKTFQWWTKAKAKSTAAATSTVMVESSMPSASLVVPEEILSCPEPETSENCQHHPHPTPPAPSHDTPSQTRMRAESVRWNRKLFRLVS